MRISKQAMGVMESCVEDTFERLAAAACQLNRRVSNDTMGARDVQAAVRLVLPGELAKHAVSEGCKAVLEYQNSMVSAAARRGGA